MNAPVIIFDKHLLIPQARAQLLSHADVGRPVDYAGHMLRVLPHDEKHTKMMWDIGAPEIPAPMLSPQNFDWPGRFRPMDHQRTVAAFKSMHPRCFDLSGLGSGKTASSIWAAEYLMRQGVVRKVGVVAPLSTLERVWVDEVFALTPYRRAVIVHGGKEKRAKALASGADYFIINHDGIKPEFDALYARDDIDLWIVDEFTAFKTHNSTRSKLMFRLCTKRRDTRLWMISGTPTPQSPVDAYFPCRMVNPEMATRLGRFRDATMLKVSDFKYVPRKDAQEIVRGYMQPAILIRKEDVLDLPPVTYIRRQATLTKEQTKALLTLKQEKLIKLKRQATGSESTSTAVNAAALMSKVLQTAQGSLITDDGSRFELDTRPRLELCRDLIEENGGKAIVFASFTGPLKVVRDYLSGYFSVGYVDGSVSASARAQTYKLFQETDDIQVLVAHPRTTSHGLTLTAANLTVWYGPTSSTETYLQANQRMNRPGQVRNMTIAQIGATAEEWAVYKSLDTNTDMQETLLALYEKY